jgi:hypothetical protein
MDLRVGLNSTERRKISLVIVNWEAKIMERSNSSVHMHFPNEIIFKTWHSLSAKVGTNFADKRLSLGRNSSFADSGHGAFLYIYVAG